MRRGNTAVHLLLHNPLTAATNCRHNTHQTGHCVNSGRMSESRLFFDCKRRLEVFKLDMVLQWSSLVYTVGALARREEARNTMVASNVFQCLQHGLTLTDNEYYQLLTLDAIRALLTRAAWTRCDRLLRF